MIIEPYQWQRVPIRELAPASIDTVHVRLPRPDAYAFRAGQYAIVRLRTADGRTIMRQYSFSSSPAEPHLELTIQKEDGGDASTWFFDHARAGDAIEISQPFGHFVWDPHTIRPLLFIAGRVGIAPFMSMIRDHRGHKSNISVLYSINRPDQACFENELAAVSATTYATATGNRITAESIRPHLVNAPLIYLCGSRQFVEAMQQHLRGLNVPPGDIRHELFTL